MKPKTYLEKQQNKEKNNPKEPRDICSSNPDKLDYHGYGVGTWGDDKGTTWEGIVTKWGEPTIIGNPHYTTCKVEVWKNSNPRELVFITNTFEEPYAGTVTFSWTGLTPNTTYSGYSVEVHTTYNDNWNKGEVYTQNLFTFTTYANPPRTPSMEIKNLFAGTTYLLLNVATDAGYDGFDNYYFSSKIQLFDQRGNEMGSSSTIPSQGKDETIIRTSEKLVDDKLYTGWKLEVSNSRYPYKKMEVNVPSFTTRGYIEWQPRFLINSPEVSESTVNIQYSLFLGRNDSGEFNLLNSTIDLYDENDDKLASNNDIRSSFTVVNLRGGNYSNWYLKANVSNYSDPIIGEIDPFTIDIGDIIVPYFSDYVVIASNTSAEVSYQFNLGKDSNGNSYEQIGIIALYNEKDQLLAASGETGDTLTVKNLEPDTTYSGWYLSGNTSYSNDPVIQLLDDFTTTSRKITHEK